MIIETEDLLIPIMRSTMVEASKVITQSNPVYISHAGLTDVANPMWGQVDDQVNNQLKGVFG